MATWHNAESAAAEWKDAPLDEDVLTELLDVAKLAVLAYAPRIKHKHRPPVNYRVGQLMQARNIWNATQADPQGDLGMEGYVITPRPLDWQVKQILRPRKARPSVR